MPTPLATLGQTRSQLRLQSRGTPPTAPRAGGVNSRWTTPDPAPAPARLSHGGSPPLTADISGRVERRHRALFAEPNARWTTSMDDIAHELAMGFLPPLPAWGSRARGFEAQEPHVV